MNFMKNVLLLVVASATISAVAAAQDTRSDAAACLDTSAALVGMYQRCALWMEGNKVHRGEEGTIVARQRIILPPRLSRFVVGDSAIRYANLFERRSKQSTALYVLSGVFVALSAFNAQCGGDYNGCAYDYGFDSPGFSLLITGGVLSVLGAGFHVSAQKAGARAVWWNNARYSR